MKKYGKLITAVLLLIILIGGARILYGELIKRYQPDRSIQLSEEVSQSEDSEASIQIPDFAMIDLEGKSVDLHGFIGKPIVLNFWASWCGPCKMELPDFQKAYEKYGEDVTFLMVNMTDGMRETQEKAQEFIKAEGYTFPVYFDALQSGAYAYRVYSLPTTYFIDSVGTIIAGAEGMLDAESLEKGISMIWDGQQSDPVSETE